MSHAPTKGGIRHHTPEAIVDDQGIIRLLEIIPLPSGRCVLVMILDKERAIPIEEVTLLSELAEDQNRPEEDAAWSHLQ